MRVHDFDIYDEDILLTLTNRSATHHSFVDLERDDSERRIVLAPQEQKRVTLRKGKVTATMGPDIDCTTETP